MDVHRERAEHIAAKAIRTAAGVTRVTPGVQVVTLDQVSGPGYVRLPTCPTWDTWDTWSLHRFASRYRRV